MEQALILLATCIAIMINNRQVTKQLVAQAKSDGYAMGKKMQESRDQLLSAWERTSN